MPILRAAYGLSREQALKLPAWEFDYLVEAYFQNRARDDLSAYQIMGTAFAGSEDSSRQLIADLKKRAGWAKPQQQPSPLPSEDEEEEPWTHAMISQILAAS